MPQNLYRQWDEESASGDDKSPRTPQDGRSLPAPPAAGAVPAGGLPAPVQPAKHSPETLPPHRASLPQMPPPQRPAPYRPRRRPVPARKARRRFLGLPLGCFWLLLILCLSACGGLSLLTLGAAMTFLPQIEAEWSARVAAIDDYRGFESTFIYDRYGNELYEAFGEGRRVHVPFERIPQSLVEATIAIEDDSFLGNIGIDIGATVVAAINFLGASDGELTPGGSTITQQLVRNIFFDFEKRAERSVARKAEEILLAIFLTQAKSKVDILEMYFNEIYYGNLAYGAQTAARTFFGKDVDQLTLGEAAMLAGLPQAPASLDPLNPEPAVQAAVDARWREVLGEMQQDGIISQEQVAQTLQAGLSFAPADVSLSAPHFTVYAQSELERILLGLGYSLSEISGGGLRVFTTLDQDVNRLTQAAAANHVAQLQAKNASNAAVVVLEPSSGEIIAMVGSVDYHNEGIDGSVNVTTALRQPGSTIKPFTYAAALERGMSPVDVLWDTSTRIALPGLPVYSPRNYDKRLHGPLTMRAALANSYNIPAVQTLRVIGVDTLLGMLRRLGISTLSEDASNYGLSLTLGGGEVSLLELTNAFAVFANEGQLVASTSIRCVLNSADEILYEYGGGCPSGELNSRSALRAAQPQRVLDPRIAFLISDMLADNRARSPAMGAHSPLRLDTIYAAVKTGTTDDVKDNWTIGYTRNVAVGVWVGNNDGEPMVDSSGLTGAAPIWNAVLRGIYGNRELLGTFASRGQLRNDRPAPPPGITLHQVCDASRLKDPALSCSATMNEWLLDGPAGIPDAAGNLLYPPAAQRYPTPVPDRGSVIREVAAGIYQTLAYPLPPELSAGIQFNVAPGSEQPVPPKYCRVPREHTQEALAAGAQELWFIAGPSTAPEDAFAAERYAREHNLAYLPTVECWHGVYGMQHSGNVGAALQIQQPANGQVVRGRIPIIGTAQFTPDQGEYYHFYIRGGGFQDWTPLGTAHGQSVVQGQLETLHADSLLRGNYVLRLALISKNGIVQSSDVAFLVP